MAAAKKGKDKSKAEKEVEAKAGSDESTSSEDKPTVSEAGSETTATTDNDHAALTKPKGRAISKIRKSVMEENSGLPDAEIAEKLNARMKAEGYVYDCTAEKIAVWRQEDSAPKDKGSKSKPATDGGEVRYPRTDIKAVSDLANRIGGDAVRDLLDLLGK